MKRGHIILIAGAALLVAGIAISIAWGISLAGSFVADNTIIHSEELAPGQSVQATRNVESLERPLWVAVGIDGESQSGGNFLIRETVTDPNGNVVSRSEFQESFTTTIDPEVTGTYTIAMINLGPEPVHVSGTFGHVPFMGPDGRPDAGAMMSGGGLGTIIAGGGLAAAGVVTLIVGAIVTVIDGRNRQGTTATSEGGITYRKD